MSGNVCCTAPKGAGGPGIIECEKCNLGPSEYYLEKKSVILRIDEISIIIGLQECKKACLKEGRWEEGCMRVFIKARETGEKAYSIVVRSQYGIRDSVPELLRLKCISLEMENENENENENEIIIKAELYRLFKKIANIQIKGRYRLDAFKHLKEFDAQIEMFFDTQSETQYGAQGY